MEDIENLSGEKTNEGRHFQLLNYGTERTFKKCLNAVRYSQLKKTLLPIALAQTDMFKQLHEQMHDQLQKNITDEMSLMFEEENIVVLMNNLDNIILDPSLHSDVPAWRPSRDPSVDILPHLYSTKLKEKARFEKILKEVEEKNRQWHEALRPRQQRLESARKRLIEECQYWEEIAVSIPEQNVDTYSDEREH